MTGFARKLQRNGAVWLGYGLAELIAALSILLDQRHGALSSFVALVALF